MIYKSTLNFVLDNCVKLEIIGKWAEMKGWGDNNRTIAD
jgi:hypothetical protein